MASALRILFIAALVAVAGLGGCGKRGSLDRPKTDQAHTKADPETKMSNAPERHLWIDHLLN